MSKSRRQLGVVMDPIAGINPKKDSTLAMMLAAQTSVSSISSSATSLFATVTRSGMAIA
jgi:hypothetical protein